MSPRLFSLSIIAASGCLACAGTPVPEPKAPEPVATAVDDDTVEQRTFEISTHEYSVRLRDGDRLWLSNAHGDLRIRNSGDGGVHYAAVVQKLDDEQRDVKFNTNRRPGGLAFDVSPPDDWNGRVDTSARVPESSALELKTTTGLLEIRSAENPIKAQSGTGDIRYRGTGPIQAWSRDGNIEVALHGLRHERQAGRLETGGDIVLWLKPEADLFVRGVASGQVVNEIPDTVGHAAVSRHSLDLRLGTGGSTLTLQAGGNITVRLLPSK